MSQMIPVRALRIEAATGATCYAGENGFFAAWAEIRDDDVDVVRVLEQHAKQGSTVTVSCGILEVTGSVSRRKGGDAGAALVVRIDAIRYGSAHVA